MTIEPGDLSTITDPRFRRRWCILDAVIRLREYGTTDRVYGLPDPPVVCKVGTAGEIRLRDESRTLSRVHAELAPVEMDGSSVWEIRDLKSRNGLRCDGEALASFPLRPGLAVSLGSLKLIAESRQLIGLLSVLRRFLGWAPERQGEVDEALQRLRDWAAQRAELIVAGDGELTSVVQRLHHLVLGREVSFIVYQEGDPVAAVKAAVGGTLCVRMHRQAEATAIADHVHAMPCPLRPLLMVCVDSSASTLHLKRSLEQPAVIELPPLRSRSSEVERIARESAIDIAEELGAPESEFSMADLERLRALAFDDLAEVEETVRRIVVLRTWGVTAGAARLGLTHSSLIDWAQRRNLAT